jgi:hypothetical protein
VVGFQWGEDEKGVLLAGVSFVLLFLVIVVVAVLFL